MLALGLAGYPFSDDELAAVDSLGLLHAVTAVEPWNEGRRRAESGRTSSALREIVTT